MTKSTEGLGYRPSAMKSQPLDCCLTSYETVTRWAGPVALSLFLLLVRIVWGWAFFEAGKGKLGDISTPIAFFEKLHIPFPTANAWLVAIVECFGGLLMLFGLGSRVVGIILFINMSVAYITADREALFGLFKESDVAKFSNATPFWFLVAAFLMFALGAGMFSIDGVLKHFVFRRNANDLPLAGR